MCSILVNMPVFCFEFDFVKWNEHEGYRGLRLLPSVIAPTSLFFSSSTRQIPDEMKSNANFGAVSSGTHHRSQLM